MLSESVRALDTDVATLTQGAEAALIDGLRDAAARSRDLTPGMCEILGPAEEFASRFPDWASMIITQARRIAALERAVKP